MKIYSEKTNKEYATVEECLKAEEAFDKAEAEKKAKEEKALAEVKAKKEVAIAERKADAEKVEAARKELVEAKKKFQEELSAFCTKHGAFHTTIKHGDEGFFDFFDNFFDYFWF